MTTILASLCYVRKDNATLMLLRNKRKNDIHEGKYNGLGGKLISGESPQECAIREVKEESGLLIKDPKMCGILTFPNFKDNEDWVVFVFSASDFETALGQDEEALNECDEGTLEWIPTNELKNLNLWEGDYHFLDWIAQGKFFSAKFIYEDKQLKDYSVDFY